MTSHVTVTAGKQPMLRLGIRAWFPAGTRGWVNAAAAHGAGR